jgi:thiosulfate dehydrogenase [quinone] large subunit
MRSDATRQWLQKDRPDSAWRGQMLRERLKPQNLPQSARILGYTTLRLAMGTSMLIHGLGRLPRYSAFVESTVRLFAGSLLPKFAVSAFARITPPVETLIGLLVFLGFATWVGPTLGGLWMIFLIFGSTLIGNYDVVAIQLLYCLIFFQLLQHLQQNEISLDRLIWHGRK